MCQSCERSWSPCVLTESDTVSSWSKCSVPRGPGSSRCPRAAAAASSTASAIRPFPHLWRGGAAGLGTLVLIAYQIIHGAAPAISKYGPGFIFDTAWQPNPPFEEFGAGVLLYGTDVTSAIALLLGGRSRSRSVSSSPCSPRDPRGDLTTGRDAGRDPQRHPRFLGSADPGTVRRQSSSRSCTTRSASSRSSANRRRPARASSPPA